MLTHQLKSIAVFILCLSLPQTFPSAYAESRNHQFTYEEVLQEALAYNHVLQASRERMQSSNFRMRSTNVNMLPDIRVLASGINNKRANDSYSTSVVITQTLYQGGKISAQRRVGRFEYNTAEWSLERAEQSLRLFVTTAWLEQLRSRDLVKVAKDALIRLRRNVEVANMFFKEGQNWRSDVLQAELALARGNQDLIKANNQVSLSRVTLNQLMGKSIDWNWQAKGNLKFKENNWQWTQARSMIEDSHPDTKQAELAMLIAKQRLNIAKSEVRPKLNLVGKLNDRRNQTLDTASSENTINLSISMPLWTWRKNANTIKSERHNLKQSEQDLAEVEQTVLLAANQAFLNVEEASLRLTILEQSMDQARENYRVNELRYKEQLATANELLDAEKILSDNERDQVSALADYLTALAQLDFAIACKPCN